MKQIHTMYVEIDDLSLASALFTIGYKPNQETPFVRYSQPGGNSKVRFFLDSAQGIQEYIQAWRTEGWEFLPENEDKMFAHLKIYHKNREKLLDVVKQSAEMVVMSSKGTTAIVSNNATEETKDLIFKKL